MLNISITGDSDIARALSDLPARIEKEAAMGAMVAALLPFVEAVKEKCPVETGSLRQSIGFTIKRYRVGRMLLGVVGALRGYGKEGREPANYAHLAEYGHRVAVGGKLDRLDHRHVKRGINEAKGVEVGFVAGHPFLRPAWEEKKQQVLETLGRIFGERVIAAVQRKANGFKVLRGENLPPMEEAA